MGCDMGCCGMVCGKGFGKVCGIPCSRGCGKGFGMGCVKVCGKKCCGMDCGKVCGMECGKEKTKQPINTNGCPGEKDLKEAAMMYFCEYCGYTAKESEFLEGECPACCTDLWTGKVNPKSIPKVFHQKQEETHEKD